jgi:hypothetical protein
LLTLGEPWGLLSSLANNMSACVMHHVLDVGCRSGLETVSDALRGVSPSLVRQLMPIFDQLTPIYMDVAQASVGWCWVVAVRLKHCSSAALRKVFDCCMTRPCCSSR